MKPKDHRRRAAREVGEEMESLSQARKTKRAKFETGSRPEAGSGKARQVSPRSPSSSFLIVGVVAVALVAGIVFLTTSGSPASARPGEAAPVSGSNPVQVEAGPDGTIRLDAATFADGKARFYIASAGGKKIPFFALRSSDGVIRAAFNACDVCYAAKKGYHQEGDEMVCNNCGQRFPSIRINEVKGGCNPAPLVRNLDGDTLVIEVGDIAEGAGYF